MPYVTSIACATGFGVIAGDALAAVAVALAVFVRRRALAYSLISFALIVSNADLTIDAMTRVSALPAVIIGTVNLRNLLRREATADRARRAGNPGEDSRAE